MNMCEDTPINAPRIAYCYTPHIVPRRIRFLRLAKDVLRQRFDWSRVFGY